MLRSLAVASMLVGLYATPLWAGGEVVDATIADIYKNRAELAGKQVRVSGEVVKVNNRIMKRNFLHLQDGTGDAGDGSNDLTVTSQDTAKIGDRVTAVGKVTLDLDFGAGYHYPLLMEEASITAGE